MKSALVCAVLLVQALCVFAQLDAFPQPSDFRFQEVTAGSKAEQLAQYSTQLEQLKLLQEREAATQAALQQQMEALHAQAETAAQVATAPVNPAATPAVPDAFSFKESMAVEAEAQTHAAASATAGSSEQKLKKLATAMTAVKEDIMAKLREAQRESAWVKDVENIVKQYKLKVKNVKKNLKKIRNDIKELIKKKRQIRNAQIQSQLQDRLEDASGDLKMIKGKLESITSQQKAFEKNRKKIALTISKINAEMKHLRGISDKPKPKAAAAKKDGAKKAEKKAKKGKKDGAKKAKASKKCTKKCAKNENKKGCLKKCAADEKKAAAKKKSFVEVSGEDDTETETESEGEQEVQGEEVQGEEEASTATNEADG